MGNSSAILSFAISTAPLWDSVAKNDKRKMHNRFRSLLLYRFQCGIRINFRKYLQIWRCLCFFPSFYSFPLISMQCQRGTVVEGPSFQFSPSILAGRLQQPTPDSCHVTLSKSLAAQWGVMARNLIPPALPIDRNSNSVVLASVPAHRTDRLFGDTRLWTRRRQRHERDPYWHCL